MEQIQKLVGIYQIINQINSKKYIGKSTNLISRWSYHIFYLMINKHSNDELQNDFNKYGITNFNFSILELVNNTSELESVEQKYINTLDLDFDYNKINATQFSDYIPNVDKFIDYINIKWLVPKGISDRELNKYKIYKDNDKQEIINKVIQCKLLKLYPYQISFNKVIDLMKNTLGYTIEDKRGNIENIKYTYKLIIDFDENKITLEKEE